MKLLWIDPVGTDGFDAVIGSILRMRFHPGVCSNIRRLSVIFLNTKILSRDVCRREVYGVVIDEKELNRRKVDETGQ